MLYEAKIVTGRNDAGTTYDEENVLRHNDCATFLVEIALQPCGRTWDVFEPHASPEPFARVHIDGGIDLLH